ncbi:MAG: GNAT family N-acetyltransferase [Caldisericales bacterium]|nr:GNAT family N-acetyltransferase [Caldisericales bacterium]
MTDKNRVAIEIVQSGRLNQAEKRKLVEGIISLNRQYQKIMRSHLDIPKNHVDTNEVDKYFYDMALDDPNNLFVVANDSDSIIGYAYGEICHRYDDLVSPPFIMMNEIAIDENCCKNKIRQALMGKIEETAKNRKIRQIIMDVHEFNKESIEACELLGFKTLIRKMIKTI